MGGGVKDRDHGYQKLFRRLAEPAGNVTVGVHEDRGGVPHGDSDLSIVDIWTIHEFGAPGAGIPERSFIRGWFDERKEENEAALRKIALAVLDGRVASVSQGLDRFGVLCTGGVQKRIAVGIDPPNAPLTVALKGSSKPLIDTGQLRSSIAHKVEKK
jgi:hypothetical protein